MTVDEVLLKIAAELTNRASRLGYADDHDSQIREIAVSDALTILAQIIEDVVPQKESADDR